jgi:hypothetical protein
MMIADGTNPWVEVDGVPVDWVEREPLHPVNDCGLCGDFLDGAIAAMDTNEGVQRCDECDLFEGDIEAAEALARLVGGVVEWIEEGEEGESW